MTQHSWVVAEFIWNHHEKFGFLDVARLISRHALFQVARDNLTQELRGITQERIGRQ